MQKQTTHKHTILLLFLALSLLFTSCTSPAETPPPVEEEKSTLQITYLDVGQGDCTFIQLPNGETMLIDAGNHKDGQSIIQYIQSQDTEVLDYVIATHPHADHIGGMAEVIRAFDVKNVYMPKRSHTSETFENLLDTIAEKNLTIQAAKTGKVLFDEDHLKAEFLAPVGDSYSNLNNYSAVLKLTYQDKRFLFMGDAEQEVENELLESGADLSADVLKVGHHGSDTSSSKEFLEVVRPSIAVISVGAGNSYGHPDAVTLTTLQELQADIWRTDEKGTVIVICNGENITVQNIDTLAQPNAPPTDTAEEAEEQQTTESKAVQSETVYITKTGTKYHRDGCRFLSKSKIAVLLEEIDMEKYTPCSVCNPPERK